MTLPPNPQATTLGPLAKSGHYGRAFTVLELLVAITIVGILVIFLTVSVRSVNMAAQSTRCVSNLRQIGAAMLHRVRDNNQVLESFHGGNDASRNWCHQLLLGSYLGEGGGGGTDNATLLSRIDTVGDILRCPSGPIEASYKTDSEQVRGHPRRWFWQAYGMGMYRTDIPLVPIVEGGKTTNYFGVKISAIPVPGQFILFADSSGVGPNYYQSFRISRNAGEGGVNLRHRGLANAFFLDGRVAQLNRSQAQEMGVPNHSIYTPAE